MTKISIDLHTDAGVRISGKALQRATAGCLKALELLGPLGEMVTTFRITFNRHGVYYNLMPDSPDFTVYFKDPLGRETSFSCHSALFGVGPNPSPREIARGLLEDLPQLMKEHLSRAVPAVRTAEDKISEMIASAD